MEPDLEMLINHGEDTKVEYKRTFKFPEKAVRAEMVRDLLAMVNAHEQGIGYILIGVDEVTQALHDAAPLGLDDGKIHSFVDEFADPPIPFSFIYRPYKGVTLGIIEVRPSADRFHLVKKNFQDADKILLTKGETWIRRGTRKDRLSAWDMKRLKDDHAKLFTEQPQPNLVVTFAEGATEIKQNVVELPGSGNVLGSVDPSFLARRFGSNYTARSNYVVKVVFCISNEGTQGAEYVHVRIDLPDGCNTVEPCEDLNSLLSVKTASKSRWHQWSNTEDRSIKISGPGITHGLRHSSDGVYLRFGNPSVAYELKWTARANNMVKPTSGVLRVLPREDAQRRAASAGSMTAEDILKAVGARSKGTEKAAE